VTTRADVIAELADLIDTVTVEHPTRVAIDGLDAAGKTTLADELAALVEMRGREAIRVSLDEFHRPRADRYRRGRESPHGYYEDSFDHVGLRAHVLVPLGTAGDLTYRPRAFDQRRDCRASSDPRRAKHDAVVLVDGVFLQRPELQGCWDLTVWVDIPLSESIRRGVARDRRHHASEREIRNLYERRYAPGQQLYLRAVDPAARADAVFDNADPASPKLVPRGHTSGTKL
jgi:uridine kinase